MSDWQAGVPGAGFKIGSRSWSQDLVSPQELAKKETTQHSLVLASFRTLVSKMASRSTLLKVVLLELEADYSDDDEEVVAAVSAFSNTSANMMVKMLRNNTSNSEAHQEDYVGDVVPRYTDYDFRCHFRMYRDAFEVSVLTSLVI